MVHIKNQLFVLHVYSVCSFDFSFRPQTTARIFSGFILPPRTGVYNHPGVDSTSYNLTCSFSFFWEILRFHILSTQALVIKVLLEMYYCATAVFCIIYLPSAFLLSRNASKAPCKSNCSLEVESPSLEANGSSNGSCEVYEFLYQSQCHAGVPYKETTFTEGKEKDKVHELRILHHIIFRRLHKRYQGGQTLACRSCWSQNNQHPWQQACQHNAGKTFKNESTTCVPQCCEGNGDNGHAKSSIAMLEGSWGLPEKPTDEPPPHFQMPTMCISHQQDPTPVIDDESHCVRHTHLPKASNTEN